MTEDIPTAAPHVVIVGCGRVGSGLARRLTEEGSTVAVVDKDARAFRRLDGVEVDRITGVGFDREVLTDAGAERASAVAAVTNGDNSNIVIARVARERFGIDNVVARIYDPRRAAIYERLGIATVATVQWTIERIAQRVIEPADGVVWIDPSARLVVIERRVPSHWAGRPLAGVVPSGAARIVTVTRLGVPAFPSPDHIAQDGDVVHLAVMADQLDAVDRHLQSRAEVH